MAHNI